MPTYAKFEEYQQVKLKHSRTTVEDRPFTELDVPRPVTTDDFGIIVDVIDVQHPGYWVEFFNDDGKTVGLLSLYEDEIEPYG